MWNIVLGMDSSPRTLIAAEVRAEMARHKMSQRVLAERIGMAPHTMQRRLALKHPFSYEELVAIADVLELPVLTLLSRAEQPSSVK